MGVESLFEFSELRVRQPGKVLAGRASYEISDDRRRLLAVATEVEARTMLGKITKLLPESRTLAVTSPDGEDLFTLSFRSAKFVSELAGPDGTLLGTVKIGGSRRHYTLLDAEGEVLGEVVGDLAVRRFTVMAPGHPPFAEVRKTFAGPVKETFTSSDNYTVKFAGTAIPPLARTLTVMVPITLDLARYGPA
jgi:Scramblase